MQLIDSHCHFDDERFDPDRVEAYQRALSAGVEALVVAGIKADWWPRVRRVCRDYPELYPAYGMHPMFMADHREEDIHSLDNWLTNEPAVAVGECGLDFYIENPDRKRQQELFEVQLTLAQKHRLPVIIHARRSVEEVFNILRRYSGLRGMLHSFSGSEQQARRLIDMGFLLSFGGPLTYPRARRLRQIAGNLPLASLMLESDAPDQPDVEYRGRRNEPARVKQVLETLAELRGDSREEVASVTTANARELFGIRR